MFAYLKGVFESRTLDYIVVDVNGIGYKIFMSENSMKRIGELGSIIKVHTYVKVREDDISIYGFASNEELRMFQLLVSVSGKLPGIGAKSAQRIILELKDKLKTIDVEDDSSEELKAVINQNQNIEELISALQVLGYTKKEVEKIIPKLDNKDDNLENLIKKALLLLSK